MIAAELLDLGVDPCGAHYFTVDVRLHSCGRPLHHPGLHMAEPMDYDRAFGPYNDPEVDPEVLAQEHADNWNDERAVGLA